VGDEEEHIIKNEKRLSVMWRDGNYRTNTSSGFTSGLWQAHHLLCNHSAAQRFAGIQDPEDLRFAQACEWITDWNLNNSHNMLGLPTNWQHRSNDGKSPADLPSHQVDHNTTGGYTQECTGYCQDHVWDALKDKSKDHKTNAANIQALLKSVSSHFAAELEAKRGFRKGGTAHCWAHRRPEPPPTATPPERANYQHEPEWYFPFSMAEDGQVNPRAPGIDWTSALADVLKKIG
jgi:hypothetical protein